MTIITYLGFVFFLSPQLALPSVCVCECWQGVWMWVYWVSFGVMYCVYQDREELEDDLYQEDEGDSEESEANSEMEFHLYSQLHYSSNAGEMEEQVDRGEGQGSQQVTEKTADGDGEQEHTRERRPPSPNMSKLRQHLKKKGEKRDQGKKGKSKPEDQKSSLFFEEVIVIDSGPDIISISDGDTSSDDEGVCALKGQGSQRLQTSTQAQQVRLLV